MFGIVAKAEALGARTAATGARLVGHVPHVAPDAYLHVVFPPLGASDLSMLEAEVGRPLPRAYAELLAIVNGLSLFFGSLSIFGRRSSHVRSGDVARQPFCVVTPNTFERPRFLPADAVVIGGYRKDGSLVHVRATGEVSRCLRDDPTPLNRWPDLWGMLAQETERLASCFDEGGHRGDGGRGAAPPPSAEVGWTTC